MIPGSRHFAAVLENLRRAPRAVWALGFVSPFMDLSSEMIHSLLPVFLVATLGASPALLGLIEGIAEATASATKVFSGWLSDRLGRRKLLAVIGYGLGAISKPIFPLAVTPFAVLAARFSDRIGKGLRGAPRDALVADVTPANLRGAAYGLRQTLDTIGAFLGPTAAILVMWLTRGDIRAVFSVAVIPALIAVAVLVFAVKERSPATQAPHRPPPIQWSEVRGIGRSYWIAVGVGVLLTMARFSEAFLILRGAGAGLPISLTPTVLIVMNLVYALVAAPAGSFSDRFGRKPLLAAGIVVLCGSDLVLAFAGGVPGVLLGAGLWGLHMGLTQSLLAALVADTAPVKLRGTAFGVFNLATGMTLLLASTLAGYLWSARGEAFTFVTGALFAAAALLGLMVLMRERPQGVA